MGHDVAVIGNEASRTAVLVCQARAVADGRIAVGRFADPIAMALLRREELVPVERARTGVPPASWRDRIGFQLLLANAEAIVPRTVAIDDAMRARPNPQVVILGAGLDGRAWRMAELAAVDVYEVDHPRSQQDKRDRCGGVPPVARSLRFVSVDFSRDALGSTLAAAGHSESLATTWIWEGVVRYLTRTEVEATVDAIAERSAPGSRLVVNYQAASLSAALSRLARRFRTALARRPDPLAREPRRSSWTPTSMRELLAANGLRVTTDDDLLTLAKRLAIPVRRPRTLRYGRVAVADRPSQ
jgi:methyltransferase (TIGR00027 family)